MNRKDRKMILEYFAKKFCEASNGWERLSNPDDLPYLAIFYTKKVVDGCWLFVGFYSWRQEKFSATVGWLSQDWHPRSQELVKRYLEGDGSLSRIRSRGSKDFSFRDFERSVGELIPIKVGIDKPYDANLENYQNVSNEICFDLQESGFEYLDLMLQHRYGKRLVDVL